MSEHVRTERRGHVFEITIDRPKANAIDMATSHAMGDAFIAFRDDADARVAIVSGAGERFFSAGWDLTETAGENLDWDVDLGPGGAAGLCGLFDLEKPVIAAVNGYCVGAAFEMVLACDMIVAAEHASFFLSDVNMGLVSEAASIQRLLARLPRAIALEMLYTGARMAAPALARHGLINRVVPGTEVMAAARELASGVTAAAPLAVAACKAAADRVPSLTAAEAHALQRSGGLPRHRQVWESEDAVEGSRAFTEKRDPKWKGR